MLVTLLAPLALLSPALSPARFGGGSVGSSRVLAAPRCQVDVAVDPKVETECGFDYVPLITALREGDFYTADQLTRDGLITLAGPAAVKRGYVYFAEVPKLPPTDLATLERLWLAFSDNKFGFSVQRSAWVSKKVGKKFEPFFERMIRGCLVRIGIEAGHGGGESVKVDFIFAHPPHFSHMSHRTCSQISHVNLDL